MGPVVLPNIASEFWGQTLSEFNLVKAYKKSV